MWSDPPATAVGTFCFFSCTDAGIERLNALLDDPANDKRPFPQLQAEAAKYQTDTYLRPRLTDAALKPMRLFHWSNSYLALVFVAAAVDTLLR